MDRAIPEQKQPGFRASLCFVEPETQILMRREISAQLVSSRGLEGGMGISCRGRNQGVLQIRNIIGESDLRTSREV
jgi:hypothetical protein